MGPVHILIPYEMGILDSICCCSCDTVCRDEPSKTHVVRAAAIKTETVEQPEVEPIDLSAVEVDDEVIEDEAVPETSEEQQTTRKYGSLSKKTTQRSEEQDWQKEDHSTGRCSGSSSLLR